MFFTGYVYIYSQRSYIQNGNRPPKLCQRSYYQQHKFPQMSCTEMKFLLGAFVTVFKWDGWMRAVGNWNCTALPLLRQRSHWCYGRTRVITPIFLLPLYYSSAEGWSSNPTSRAAALWQRGRCAGQEGTAISIPFLLCSVLHPSCSRAHWMGEAPRCTLRFSGPFPHQGLLQRGCTGLGEQGQLSANPVVKVDGRACLRSSAPCFDGHDLLEWRRKTPYCPPRVKLAETVLFCRWTLALLAPSALRFSLFLTFCCRFLHRYHWDKNTSVPWWILGVGGQPQTGRGLLTIYPPHLLQGRCVSRWKTEIKSKGFGQISLTFLIS